MAIASLPGRGRGRRPAPPPSGGLLVAHQAWTSELNQYEKRVSERERLERERADGLTRWIHEAKTPVAALALAVDSLTASGDISRGARAALEAELARLAEVTEGMLWETRLAAPDRDCAIAAIDLGASAREALVPFSRHFRARNLIPKLNLNPSPVLSDPKWTVFILRQLLSNAAKYAVPGGTVTLSSGSGPDGGASVSVSDSGPGIPPEDLPRLFDRGFTGASGRAGGERSTGMGLYLARGAALALGATLEAASVPGVGSTFTLAFPPPEELTFQK